MSYVPMSSGHLLIWENFEFWNTNICFRFCLTEKKFSYLSNKTINKYLYFKIRNFVKLANHRITYQKHKSRFCFIDTFLFKNQICGALCSYFHHKIENSLHSWGWATLVATIVWMSLGTSKFISRLSRNTFDCHLVYESSSWKYNYL